VKTHTEVTVFTILKAKFHTYPISLQYNILGIKPLINIEGTRDAHDTPMQAGCRGTPGFLEGWRCFSMDGQALCSIMSRLLSAQLLNGRGAIFQGSMRAYKLINLQATKLLLRHRLPRGWWLPSP